MTEPTESVEDVDTNTDFDPATADDSDLDPETTPKRSASDRDGPLGDLAATVDERISARSEDDAGDGTFDDLFEQEDVAALDREQLWERLENEDDPPVTELLEDDREIREIDKYSYCNQCEHFSEPPAVGCTHEGTDILELASLERFRVADCPVVLEDEELERQY